MEENTSPEISQPQLSESLTKPTKLSKILAMILFIALPFAGFYLGMKYQAKIAVNKDDSTIEPAPIACTMEAKQCPDGSYVSRTGPNCEFSPCPANDETGNWKTYSDEKYNFSLLLPNEYEVKNFDELNESPYSISILSNGNTLIVFSFGQQKINRMENTGEIITKQPPEMPNITLGSASYPASKYYYAEGVPSEYNNCFNSLSSSSYLAEINSNFIVEIDKISETNCNPDGTQKKVKETTDAEITTAKQILSTFKFID